MTDFISSICRAPFLTIIVWFRVVRLVFSVSWPVNLIMCNAAVNSYQAALPTRNAALFSRVTVSMERQSRDLE